jgi:hypothetical protein
VQRKRLMQRLLLWRLKLRLVLQVLHIRCQHMCTRQLRVRLLLDSKNLRGR